jgi:uncharacterized protein (TIGR02996 family)
MSDDAAFLATIQASPDDDAPRLVYADWLEERNDVAKSEYLRLVHSLTILPDEAPERPRLVKRLIKVAGQIDETWRGTAGRRFDVVMEGFLGGAMFVFMKAVHWLTGARTIGAMEPNDVAHTITLRRGVRREEAETYASEMDSQRFSKKRETKTPYRIVPSANERSEVGDQRSEAKPTSDL